MSEHTQQQTTEQTTGDGYTIWSVHRRAEGATGATGAGDPLADEIEALEAEGVVTRGIYDVSGLRHDADIMVWMHGSSPQALQAAVRRVRRSRSALTSFSIAAG